MGKWCNLPQGGKKLAGLAIDLMKRKRVKVAGRMVAGTMTEVEVEGEDKASAKQIQLQLITQIDQSLGNCPKYLNQYEIRPANVTQSRLVHKDQMLSGEGQALIAQSDMFFLSTSTENDQDVNHRGGPPGFVRIISPNQIMCMYATVIKSHILLTKYSIRPRILR